MPAANFPVQFSIKGAGNIIGVDNGDPAYTGQLKADSIPSFNGLCLVVVQSTPVSGEIKLTAESAGLKGDTVNLIVR